MRRRLAGGPAALIAALIAISGAAAASPLEVNAVYDVTFNGFGIGDFRFKSKTSGGRYTIEGVSKLSMLLGAFKWKGAFKTTGAVEEGPPHPAAYSFTYDSGKKRGSVKMSFAGAAVSKVALDPPKKRSRLAVPLKAEHMNGVLDPLSVIMAMTRYESGNPCQGKLPVFDGQRRFDIELSPHGKQGSDYVCRLRYLPVAGHKPNKENQALSDGVIEVVLRPDPAAKIVLPSRITVPTAWGKAVLTSKKVTVRRN